MTQDFTKEISLGKEPSKMAQDLVQENKRLFLGNMPSQMTQVLAPRLFLDKVPSEMTQDLASNIVLGQGAILNDPRSCSENCPWARCHLKCPKILLKDLVPRCED